MYMIYSILVLLISSMLIVEPSMVYGSPRIGLFSGCPEHSSCGISGELPRAPGVGKLDGFLELSPQ